MYICSSNKSTPLHGPASIERQAWTYQQLIMDRGCPSTFLSFFDFLLVSSTLRNNGSLNFFDISFLFTLISFLVHNFKNNNKNTRHLFFCSFFLTFLAPFFPFFFSSQVCLLLRLLTCLLLFLLSFVYLAFSHVISHPPSCIRWFSLLFTYVAHIICTSIRDCCSVTSKSRKIVEKFNFSSFIVMDKESVKINKINCKDQLKKHRFLIQRRYLQNQLPKLQ